MGMQDLARRLAAGGWQLFLDIGTLREPQFTGIPNVAANLARELLEAGIPCRCFIGDSLIRPEYLRFLLETGGGAWFGYHHQHGETQAGSLPAAVRAAGGRAIGLFPAEKPFHRLFDVEVQVLHDFSTIVAPYFHLHATTELHGASLLRDVASNDLNVCVSAATAGYLATLCPEVASRIVVAPNGVHWPERLARLDAQLYGSHAFEPYVVILGTIEPRKNLDVVFRAFARDRALLRRYRWVFLGREGWLFDFEAALRRHLGEVPESVTYGGYVNEFRKYALLRHATFTVYPSLFEGFGLPILESFSLGTPCVHSGSTAMPEVGGEAGFAFHPEREEELLAAVARLEAARATDGAGLAEACRARAAGFTWTRMLGTILAATLAVAADGAVGSAA